MLAPVENRNKREGTTSKLSDELGVGSGEQYPDSEEEEVILDLSLGRL